jgi:hypothetical protein
MTRNSDRSPLLASHRVPGDPPRELEERVVASLRGRGLLQPVRSSARIVRRLSWLAAASVLFAMGMLAGVAFERREVAVASDRPRFALMLYGDTAAVRVTSAEIAASVRAHQEWARRLASTGHTVSGEKLGDRATAIGGSAPLGSALQGFFIVGARDEAEAVEIAKSMPHKGSIVVRPIDRT